MDLPKEYEKLYEHWLKEFQDADLTELNQELFKEYKTSCNFINDYQEEHKDELKDSIIRAYKDNLNFLFNDFLKIREIKIINSALALEEIKLDNLIEAEKLLYQNIISSIKGYQKVKAASLYEDDKAQFEEIIKSTVEIKKSVKDIPSSSEDQLSVISEAESKIKREEISYIPIRFLKITPPLVGIDLINYGPFEKEDIANIPQQNANILIMEKFAEKIDIS
ncbi:MAG: hypothetical protein ACFE91_07410 [Promethearchaeota archaeon]